MTRSGRELFLTSLLASSSAAMGQNCVWTNITPATSPPGRYDAAIAYDSARGRVVLFGGTSGSGLLGDTWEWDGAAWTLRSTSGPPARMQHAMAYHAARARTVLFGGTPADGRTWEWDGSQWTALPAVNALVSSNHAMAYDAAHDRLIIQGGVPSVIPPTREFDSTGQWNQIPINAIPAWGGCGMVYNPDRQRITLVGGYGVNQSTPAPGTWEFDSVTSMWSQVSAQPALRNEHAMLYDPVRQRIVTQGGLTFSNVNTQTWEYDPAAATWTRRADDGPGWRYGASMVFDVAHSAALSFGGYTTSPLSPSLAASDLWRFNGANTGAVLVLQLPADQAVAIGQSVTLTAAFSGANSFQWYRWNVPLVNGPEYSGVDTPTLTIQAASAADASRFTCAASASGCSAAEAGASVQVQDPACYANCDLSTHVPILNANDFQCFLNLFATGDSRANCDQTTTPPILTANDFHCFLNRYALGCG